MGVDYFDILFSSLILLIYGSICFIAILLTFSLETYLKLYERMNFTIFSTPILTPVEKSINWLDSWAVDNNVILGPILIILSLIDIRLFFNLINSF
jgi:hypothetical protein